MMKPQPTETEIIGAWNAKGHSVEQDPACDRIAWLTEHYFKKLASSPTHGDWETLFEDPADGRLWERTFPAGDLQGGGPPRLAVIDPRDAQVKYEIE